MSCRHSLHELMTSTGLLLIRLMVGWVFVFHGAQKMFGVWGGHGINAFAEYLGPENMGVPLPYISAWLAASSEFFGGALLILGLATRVAAIPLIITMAVAALMAHAGKFAAGDGGMEYALTLGVMNLALLFTGPGRFSLDYLLGFDIFDLMSGQGRKKPSE